MHYSKQAKDFYIRNTRNSNRLVSEIVPKSTLFQRNCSWMCIQIYNKIPENIKVLNFNRFKAALYRWLLHNLFYSVKEYLHNGQ
jgi:hypothetical protein